MKKLALIISVLLLASCATVSHPIAGQCSKQPNGSGSIDQCYGYGGQPSPVAPSHSY